MKVKIAKGQFRVFKPRKNRLVKEEHFSEAEQTAVKTLKRNEEATKSLRAEVNKLRKSLGMKPAVKTTAAPAKPAASKLAAPTKPATRNMAVPRFYENDMVPSLNALREEFDEDTAQYFHKLGYTMIAARSEYKKMGPRKLRVG